MNESSLFGPGVENIWQSRKRKRSITASNAATGVSQAQVAMLGNAEQQYVEGKSVEAIATLSNIIKEVPRWSEPYTVLALIYEDLGHKEAALQLYLLIAGLTANRKKKSIETWKKIAFFAMDMGHAHQAMVALSKVLRAEGTLPQPSDPAELQKLSALRVCLLAQLTRMKGCIAALKAHSASYPQDDQVCVSAAAAMDAAGFPSTAARFRLSYLHRHHIFVTNEGVRRVRIDGSGWLGASDEVFFVVRALCTHLLLKDALLVIEVIESLFAAHHAREGAFPADLLLLLGYAKLLAALVPLPGQPPGSVPYPGLDALPGALREDEEVDVTPALLILDPLVQQLLQSSGEPQPVFLLTYLLRTAQVLLAIGMTSKALRIVTHVRGQLLACTSSAVAAEGESALLMLMADVMVAAPPNALSSPMSPWDYAQLSLARDGDLGHALGLALLLTLTPTQRDSLCAHATSYVECLLGELRVAFGERSKVDEEGGAVQGEEEEEEEEEEEAAEDEAEAEGSEDELALLDDEDEDEQPRGRTGASHAEIPVEEDYMDIPAEETQRIIGAVPDEAAEDEDALDLVEGCDSQAMEALLLAAAAAANDTVLEVSVRHVLLFPDAMQGQGAPLKQASLSRWSLTRIHSCLLQLTVYLYQQLCGPSAVLVGERLKRMFICLALSAGQTVYRMQPNRTSRRYREILLLAEVLQAAAGGPLAAAAAPLEGDMQLLLIFATALPRFSAVDVLQLLGAGQEGDVLLDLLALGRDLSEALDGPQSAAVELFSVFHAYLVRYPPGRRTEDGPLPRPQSSRRSRAHASSAESSSSNLSSMYGYLEQQRLSSTVPQRFQRMPPARHGCLRVNDYLSTVRAFPQPLRCLTEALLLHSEEDNIALANYLAQLMGQSLEEKLSVKAILHCNPHSFIAYMMSGNENALFKRHGLVLEDYLHALSLLGQQSQQANEQSSPKAPQAVLYLALACYLLMLANHPLMRTRGDLLQRAWAMLVLYSQCRLKEGISDPAVHGERIQEVYFNMGRACQETKLDHFAVIYYKLALQIPAGKLTCQTAHNLRILYTQAGHKDMAFQIMQEYLSFD